MFPGQPRNGECGGECGKRGWQSSSPLVRKMHKESDGSRPVVENRLFEPRLPEQTRSDPVAGLSHGARYPGVTRLIRSDEADSAQVAKKTGGDRCRRQGDGPERLAPMVFAGFAQDGDESSIGGFNLNLLTV